MSEFDFSRAEQELFDEELFADDAAMDDPDIARETKKARELNVILHETPITFVEAMTLQAELDEGVQQWIHGEFPVTGMITPDQDAKAARNGGLPAKIVSGEMLEFSGFTVRGAFSKDDDSTVIGAKVMYAFRAPAMLFDDELTGKAARKKLYAYGDLDSCQIDPQEVTVERSMRWLQSVAPDFMNDIDGLMYNGETNGMGDELLLLKDFDLNGYDKYLDDEFTRECMEKYVQHLINLDGSMPYSLGIDGDIELRYGDLRKSDFEQVKGGVLASIFGPYIKPDQTNPNGTGWSFQVEAALHLPGAIDDIPPVIRFNAVQCKALFSLRAAYYGK